jgi:hypothetical protein
MTPEEKETLNDLLSSLREMNKQIADVPEPTKAILVTNIFLMTQKIRYLFGER